MTLTRDLVLPPWNRVGGNESREQNNYTRCEEGGKRHMTQLRRTCQSSLRRFPYRVIPGKEPYHHLDGHIIRKPLLSRFQISTHLNPTPISLFQYSALNGVYSDRSQQRFFVNLSRLPDNSFSLCSKRRWVLLPS